MDLNAAMASITSRLKGLGVDDVEQVLIKCLEKVRIPGPRGEKGDPGACVCREPKDGKDGVAGKDAPIPSFVVGKVVAGVAGEKAAAELKRDSNGVYVLSLTLPMERGIEGKASTVPGPIGRPGKDAEPPTEAQIAAIVHKFLEANVEKFRGLPGVPGQSIKGEPGPRGEIGMTRPEIEQAVLKILSTAGVLQANERLLVSIRAKLRSKINEADSRSIAEISSLVRSVDRLFDAEEQAAPVAPVVPTPAVSPAQIEQIVQAAVQAALPVAAPTAPAAAPTEEKKEPAQSWFKSLVKF